MENSFPGGGGGCCRCQPRSPSRGHLQRRGGGKAGAVLHHRPSRLRGEAAGEGRGGAAPLLPAHHLSPATHTDTHTQRRRRELGGRSVWRDRRAKGSVPPAEGRQGAVAVCVYVSAGGCGGGAAGGGGLPASAARRRASPVCVSGGGGVCGAAGPPSGLPGAGELPGAERRFVVPTPTAPRGVGGGARGV